MENGPEQKLEPYTAPSSINSIKTVHLGPVAQSSISLTKFLAADLLSLKVLIKSLVVIVLLKKMRGTFGVAPELSF